MADHAPPGPLGATASTSAAAPDDAARELSQGLPIMAPPGASPALASDPLRELDPSHHAYESNPAPWWMAIAWIVFLVGGAAYLVVNLMR